MTRATIFNGCPYCYQSDSTLSNLKELNASVAVIQGATIIGRCDVYTACGISCGTSRAVQNNSGVFKRCDRKLVDHDCPSDVRESLNDVNESRDNDRR